jgi:cytochrome c peroxidase
LFSRPAIDNAVFHLLAVTVALLGSAIVPCHSDAIVGATRTIDLPLRGSVSDAEIRTSYKRPTTIPFPAYNPYTVQKNILGKKLYFNSRLSRGKLLSCASCHSPGYAWADGQPTSCRPFDETARAPIANPSQPCLWPDLHVGRPRRVA